jgi:hypothetical protein
MISTKNHRIDYLFQSIIILQANWTLIKKRGKLYFFGEVSGEFDVHDILPIGETGSYLHFFQNGAEAEQSHFMETSFILHSHSNGRILLSAKYKDDV